MTHQTENEYIYVFVRKDIPIADQIVQVGHVCYESGLRFNAKENTFMVLCQVNSEEELCTTMYRLIEMGVEMHQFIEPDNDLGLTALCSQPVSGKQRHLFRKYKLWS